MAPNGILDPRSTRTVIVAEAGTVRQMLSDAVRALGFLDLIVLGSGQDALNLLEVEECDWLIMPFMANSPVNALQILRVITNTPRLRGVRTSLMYDPQEDVSLPTAFALGLMSCHPKSYLRDDVAAEFKSLQEHQKNNAWKPTLVAAEYLRRYLLKAKQFDAILHLEQSLLALFPGSTALLLRLGEAQILNGKHKEGLATLHQATIIDDNAKVVADAIATRLLNTKVGAPRAGQTETFNVLGIKTCVLVDPDSAVLNDLRALLERVGVPNIQLFDNGTAAWEWLSTNDEPDLILQEWRIPGLSGPMLLQRIRQHGFVSTPITVISSTIKPKEVHLLREMGVDDVIAKPFARQSLFKNIVWTIQQDAAPTERDSLERKIGRLLNAGHITEAERLRTIFMADVRIPTAAKRLVQAEFAFHYGRYREACDVGIESMRLSGDSLRLLNLIGKALIKLGDHGAALKFFEKAHALSPMNVEHLCNLAVSQFDAGDEKAAAAAIDQAKKIDRSNEMVGQTDTQLAILGGNTDKAKELMGQLSSVNKIVAYMNNRAVALTRCGRYEEGIKLYVKTAESLPGEWGEIHDVVAYNTGLAFARYGELADAAESLTKILDRPAAPMFKKAQSLLQRIKHAEKTGGALALYQSSTTDEQSAADEESLPVETGSVTTVLEISRGDICLYSIFQNDTMDEESERMLAKAPRFVERSAISRNGINQG